MPPIGYSVMDDARLKEPKPWDYFDEFAEALVIQRYTEFDKKRRQEEKNLTDAEDLVLLEDLLIKAQSAERVIKE